MAGQSFVVDSFRLENRCLKGESCKGSVARRRTAADNTILLAK